MTDFIKSLELRSKDLPAYILCDAIYSKDDLDQEIANSTKELELSPNDEFTYHYRGTMCYKKGDFDRAIEDLNKALELQPRLCGGPPFSQSYMLLQRRLCSSDSRFK